MKRFICSSLALIALIISNPSSSASLCAKISSSSDWDGGVFSVINSSGVTVMTTGFLSPGQSSCTKAFIPGEYIVRFTGYDGKKSLNYPGISGCITGPYLFNEEEKTSLVFNDNLPPFNGSKECRAPK